MIEISIGWYVVLFVCGVIVAIQTTIIIAGIIGFIADRIHMRKYYRRIEDEKNKI